MSFKLILILFFSLSLSACDSAQQDINNDTTSKDDNGVLKYSVLNVYNHNASYYTQGFIYLDGNIIEGTGLKGESKLVNYNLMSGKINKEVKIPNDFFGEGVTLFKNLIYQLTWQEHKVFVYDTNFKKIKTFNWQEEGWGITHNDSFLIISTGSNTIYFVEPITFQIVKKIDVLEHGSPLSNLNELEFVNQKIYANVYGKEIIVEIDPETGNILKKADFGNLLNTMGITNHPQQINAGYVLNGIAYNPQNQSFFITGKCWSQIFEIKFQ